MLDPNDNDTELGPLPIKDPPRPAKYILSYIERAKLLDESNFEDETPNM